MNASRLWIIHLQIYILQQTFFVFSNHIQTMPQNAETSCFFSSPHVIDLDDSFICIGIPNYHYIHSHMSQGNVERGPKPSTWGERLFKYTVYRILYCAFLCLGTYVVYLFCSSKLFFHLVSRVSRLVADVKHYLYLATRQIRQTTTLGSLGTSSLGLTSSNYPDLYLSISEAWLDGGAFVGRLGVKSIPPSGCQQNPSTAQQNFLSHAFPVLPMLHLLP